VDNVTIANVTHDWRRPLSIVVISCCVRYSLTLILLHVASWMTSCGQPPT